MNQGAPDKSQQHIPHLTTALAQLLLLMPNGHILHLHLWAFQETLRINGDLMGFYGDYCTLHFIKLSRIGINFGYTLRCQRG